MPSSEPTALAIKLDPVSLLWNASGPVRITVIILLVAGTAVWLIAILKFLQLSRLHAAERTFEQAAQKAGAAKDLYATAAGHASAPGSRIVMMLGMRGHLADVGRLRAVAGRALVDERIRVSTLLSLLGSIAAASPFIGLFGTVYGIMDAFIRIANEKSASLPVVAPAIGEALITTAIGLAAAIPAVIFYNAIDRRVTELLDEVEASAEEWVLSFAESADPAARG
jgi:biopolymer transport protein TolQ